MKGIDLHRKEQAAAAEFETKKSDDKELLVDLLAEDENHEELEDPHDGNINQSQFDISEGNLKVSDERKLILDGMQKNSFID